MTNLMKFKKRCAIFMAAMLMINCAPGQSGQLVGAPRGVAKVDKTSYKNAEIDYSGELKKQDIKVKNIKLKISTNWYDYQLKGLKTFIDEVVISDETVVKVEDYIDSVEITPMKIGTTKITIKTDGDDEYAPASVSFKVTVVPQTPQIKKLKVKGRYMCVNWKKAKGAKKCRIWVKRVNSSKKPTTSIWMSYSKFGTGCKFPIKKGAKYKIKIQACDSSGKYKSYWSKVYTKKA